jgi:hypothetical protein
MTTSFRCQASPSDKHFFWSILLCERHHLIRANIAHHDTNETAMNKGLEHFTPKTFEILAKLYAKDLDILFSGRKFCIMERTLRNPNKLPFFDYLL